MRSRYSAYAIQNYHYIINTYTASKAKSLSINVIENDVDVDAPISELTVTVSNNPSNGAAVSNNDGTVTYTPNPDFHGQDTFR